jgi:hypothetical protein
MGRTTNAERERRAKEAEAAAAEAPSPSQITTSKTDPSPPVIAAAAEPAPAPKKRGRTSNAELARRKALKTQEEKEAAQEVAAAAPSTSKPEEDAAPRKRGGKSKPTVEAPVVEGAGADSNGDVPAGKQLQEPVGAGAGAAAAEEADTDAEGVPARTAASPRKAKKAAVQALAEQSCVNTPPTEKKMRGRPKAAKGAEASEAGTSKAAGEAQAAPEPSVWTKADVEALRSAVSKVDPLSNNLWREIAEMVRASPVIRFTKACGACAVSRLQTL